jgi:hypothetical protein
MTKDTFIKGVERLVDPINVGTLHFVESFTKMIPKKTQEKLVEKSGEKTPYMGFVVEPYSYFLCYELKDLNKASALLPDGFKLVKTSIFEDDDPKYYGIFGCFNAHTSGFWGMRVEFYIIAEDCTTGLMSWIIVDYDTNTITYDPKNGFTDPNASASLITTDFDGQLYIDVRNENGRNLVVASKLEEGTMTHLDQRLWIEGNLSIAYGRIKTQGNPGLFSLIFNPQEFERALKMPKGSYKVDANNWFPGLFEDEPAEVACFPYAQHFLSDSPGHASQLFNEKELVDKLSSVDFSQINVFSTKGFSKMIIVGGLLSVLSNSLLLGLLLFG